MEQLQDGLGGESLCWRMEKDSRSSGCLAPASARWGDYWPDSSEPLCQSPLPAPWQVSKALGCEASGDTLPGQEMRQEPAFHALRGLREARSWAQQLLPTLPSHAPTPWEMKPVCPVSWQRPGSRVSCTQRGLSPVERQVTRGHEDSPGKSTHSMGHTWTWRLE